MVNPTRKRFRIAGRLKATQLTFVWRDIPAEAYATLYDAQPKDMETIISKKGNVTKY